jgi:chromosome segregation ATPase
VIEKFRQLREIQHELAKLEGQVQEMDGKQSSLEDKLGSIDSKQENIGASVHKLIGEDADPYVSLGDSDLYDLLYESIHEWAAKQLSTERP